MVSGGYEAAPDNMSMDGNTDTEPMDISGEVETLNNNLGVNK